MTPVAFALAAAVGAVVRFAVARRGWGWLGTLAVNIAGSLVLGWVLARPLSDDLTTVVGVGFCGSLTTFSTFSLEAMEATGRTRRLVVGAHVVGCLGAALLGHTLGRLG